jgi:signal transduction histidine kinase
LEEIMASFLTEHLDEIVSEWETFARTLTPAAATMDSLALRDHARQMLEAISKDIQTAQSDRQQTLKSQGLGPVFNGVETAAAAHGILRHQVGFDLAQLVAEFRALRASVLRLWVAKEKYGDADSAYELARFNEALDQALSESVATYSAELAKSRDMFLGILGHDLRSPLGAVSSALHVLAMSTEESVRNRASAAAVRSVAAMSAMIRDLLEYTRTRLGKGIAIAPVPANLESVCKAAIEEIGLVHPQTAFRFEAGGRLDGVFDVERIHQVLSNLLNNAVEHGTRGRAISLVASGDEGKLGLKMTNAGSALEPSHLQVIFEPLVQVPAKQEDARGATNLGLGLFIAREIVLAHGGTIEATSSGKDGTTFSIELPRSRNAPVRTQAGGRAARPAVRDEAARTGRTLDAQPSQW